MFKEKLALDPLFEILVWFAFLMTWRGVTVENAVPAAVFFSTTWRWAVRWTDDIVLITTRPGYG